MRKGKTVKRFVCIAFIVLAGLYIVACAKEKLPTTKADADASNLTPQVPEKTPVQSILNEQMVSFSSISPSFCFSYPQGYTLLPDAETVEIVAPELSSTDLRGLFWLETSEAYDRTAEVIANQELTTAGVNVDQWSMTVGGEPAVVLDGMPGQDLQRRVYIVHQGTLYILAFMPTLSENDAANSQVEALYNAITSSWAWAPCAGSK
jgi:hypothetical protein